MESIEPFARHIPYLVGVGNHGARASRVATVQLQSATCGRPSHAASACAFPSATAHLQRAMCEGPSHAPPALHLSPPPPIAPAEYDYERGGSNRGVPDASGELDPYQPPWGNFGGLGLGVA